jgi:hypothetical protein
LWRASNWLFCRLTVESGERRAHARRPLHRVKRVIALQKLLHRLFNWQRASSLMQFASQA